MARNIQQPGVNVDWGVKRPWFDWQLRFLSSTVDEIGLFGGKSGGKSAGMRGWLVSGNPNLPDDDKDGQPLLVNRSYCNHPEYTGLILRRNEKDLRFFLREAERMWKPLGMEYKNGYFESPVGARIDCGHLADENSWQKYLGNEYQRIAIDEVGLIPEYGMIEELRSCMRTPNPEMRIQIVYASNAGGPGTGWIIDRFMNVLDANGDLIPHDTVIEEKRIHPITGKEQIKTRIWMFSTVQDNTVIRETDYASDLKHQKDEKRVKAYFYGLWDALYGSYFGDLFRPDGPVLANGEPSNACHVVTRDKTEIKPWWHRSISMDWGYAHDSAILWACQSPDGRVIIYRELAADKTSPELLGYEIGMRSRDELRASSNKSMVLHLSHDAFHNDRGERTIAELIAAGIARVLGRDAVHIPDMEITRLKDAWATEPVRWDQTVAQQKAIDGIKLQRRLGITIRMAQKTGPIGWMHCRELMRWKSIGLRNTQYDPAYAATLSPEQQFEYVQTFRMLKPEALPRLQIIREECPKLIAAIPKAQHEDGTENIDKKHFSGKDLIDSLHYLVMGLRDEIPAEPFEAFQERQMLDIAGQYGGALTLNDKIHINRALEQQWKDKSKPVAPYTPPRHARSARLMRQGILKPTDGYRERVN